MTVKARHPNTKILSLSWTSYLPSLHSYHSRFTSQSQHRPRKDVLNAISFQVSGCRSEIETFKGNIQGYERSEGLQGAWRKITWIFKADDVAALRAKLTAHRAAIAILLSLSISCVQLLFTRNRPHQVPPVSPHAAIKLTVRVRWDTRLRTQCSWWMHWARVFFCQWRCVSRTRCATFIHMVYPARKYQCDSIAV